jgi:RNA polymerase sigma-70 factor (ECF subfamily)
MTPKDCHKLAMADVSLVMVSIGKSLAGAFVQRSDSEFEYLFMEHYERVFRILIQMTGNRGQAEELANEVFWRLSAKPEAWLLGNDVGPWLYRAAVNAGIDAFRAFSKRVRYEDNALREANRCLVEDDPLNTLLRQENRIRVQRVLSLMKPERARILLLRSCGASYRELALALQVSVASVGTLLNRAEEDFRKRYLARLKQEEAK